MLCGRRPKLTNELEGIHRLAQLREDDGGHQQPDHKGCRQDPILEAGQLELGLQAGLIRVTVQETTSLKMSLCLAGESTAIGDS